MPRRLRSSKRRSQVPVDPFVAALGPSPKLLGHCFPDSQERRRFELRWRRWDRSLAAARWRLDGDIPLLKGAQVRLVNAVAGRRLLTGRERLEKVEATFRVHRDAIDELLDVVVPEPPPPLPE